MSWWSWMLFLICPHLPGLGLWNFFSQGQCWFNWKESCSHFLFWLPPYPSHMHSGRLEKPVPNSKEYCFSLPWNCLTTGTALCFQNQCDFYLGLLEILPNNQNKQWYISLLIESARLFREYSPMLLSNFFLIFFLKFLFYIMSCWIQLLFNIFMTTHLVCVCVSFPFFRLRNTQRYNQVLPQYLISLN